MKYSKAPRTAYVKVLSQNEFLKMLESSEGEGIVLFIITSASSVQW